MIVKVKQLQNNARSLYLSSLFSQELVLRDNQMTKIPDASIFKKLLVFDVSFNEITSLHGLSKVSNSLKELYVSKNEVAKMEELDHFLHLQILELGSNSLRVCSLHLLLKYFLYRFGYRMNFICAFQ